jgi:hypothetical protein
MPYLGIRWFMDGVKPGDDVDAYTVRTTLLQMLPITVSWRAVEPLICKGRAKL